MTSARVLVTGATGYIGHCLARHLIASGSEIHALLRPGSLDTRLPAGTIIHRQPLDATALVTAIQPDTLYHLAAPSGRAGMAEIRDWIGLSLDLIDGAQRVERCRFVLAGTWWQYDAEGAQRLSTLYAAGKQAVQDILCHYAEFQGLSACIAVLFDVYGPGDWRGKMLSALIAATQPIPATEGTQRMDLIHVDDAVTGLAACGAAREPDGAGWYTLGSARRLSVRDVAGLVATLRGAPLDLRWGALPAGPAPATPLAADRPPPGWRASIPLEDGLRQVIAHG